MTHRRSRAQRGFSLVELMVAALLSGVVLLAIYFVFITNTEQYYRQEQIVQMQERMRFATEYLKNDLRNAGRLAVVNGAPGASTDPGFCGTQVGLTALQLFEGEDEIPALTAGANGLTPDRLRLLIDSSGALSLRTAAVSGAEVTIAPIAQQPTTDGRSVLRAGNTAVFNAMIKPGYFLRIHNLDRNQTDLIPITGVNAGASPTIQLSRPPCVDITGCGGRCDVNPVQLVEYSVQAHPDEATRSQLVRQVIDAESDDVLEGPLVIADYVVDMQIWGTYDSRAAGSRQPVLAADPNPQDTVGNWPGALEEAAVMNAQPHRLRAVNMLLATRTQREDPTFRVAPGVADGPNARVAADRLWFDLKPAEPGYSRVTTLIGQVSTPNLYRGLDR